MTLLKEDGSLDVERINQLPIEQYEDVLAQLSEERFEEYLSKNSINENHGPIRINYIEGEMDEYMTGRGCMKAEDAITKIKEKYGLS